VVFHMIILINGASSSGKTSLARALQAGWEGPLLHWSLADAAYDLVVDYLFLNEDLLLPFTDSLRSHQLCFVGLNCDEDLLAKRNLERRDRASRLAVAQQSSIHFCQQFYDLSLDSSQESPEELARVLLDFLGCHTMSKGIGQPE
jgi:chloramphenicol 3-O-phosphotransferase